MNSRKRLPLIASNLYVSYLKLLIRDLHDWLRASFHVLGQEEANCCVHMLWLRILWPQGSIWFIECPNANILDSFLHFPLGLFLWAQFSSMQLIIEEVEFVFDCKIGILRMFFRCCRANVFLSFSNFNFIRECLRITEGILCSPVIRHWKN